MEDDFDSPDSDGHASIPSPTETSFNISHALQSLRVWPPTSSASPSSGDENDESPIVVLRRRNSKKTKRVLSSIVDASPNTTTPSRVLRPANSNDPPLSTPKQSWSKRSSDNLSPQLDISSDEGDDIVQSDEQRYDGGDESDSSIIVPSTSEASTPHPESTPDIQTGLSKRVAVRKPRNSPTKHQSPTRKSGSPSAPTNRFSGEQHEVSSDDGEEDTMLPALSPENEGQTKKRTATGSSTPHRRSTAGGTGAMLPPDTPESLEDKPQVQNQKRTASEMSTTSVMRNEIFEEIDPSVIADSISQAPEPVLPEPPTRRMVSFGNLGLPETSEESAVDSMDRISGNSSDSAIPQTPPNKSLPRRKLIQAKEVPSGFSFKHNTTSNTISPINLNKGMFAPGTKPGNKRKESHSTALPSSLSGTGRPATSPESSGSNVADKDHETKSQATTDGNIFATPHHPYRNFDIWGLKNNKLARRVSMSTPPSASVASTPDSEVFSKDLPSPLPSDFRVSREHRGGRPHTAADVVGADHIFEEPSLGNEDFRLRERSKSNPLDSIPRSIQVNDRPSRQLFDADRVEKVGDVAPGSAGSSGEPDRKEGSSTVGDTSSETASDATPRLRVLEVRDSKPNSSDDEGDQPSKNTKNSRDDKAGHPWSGFSETSRSTTPSYDPGHAAVEEKDTEDMFNSQLHMASSSHDGSLRLGDVEVRVQTPNSVRGDESELQDDPVSMRRHIVDLRQALNQALKKDEEQREKIQKLSDTVAQYEDEYRQVHNDVELYRQRVRFLEKQVVEFQAEVTRHQKGFEGSPVTPQVHKYTLRIAELQAKIDSLKTEKNQQVENREQENEEHENTIRHLRAALDQQVNSTINEPLQKRIVELEHQLQLEREASKEKANNTENKYKELLAEQDGIINHLQAELDEYANAMPVDPGDRTSRIFDADDAGGWMDERSQDMSQFFEDSLDHILTQIGGITELDNFDEAAEEAEKSLRNLASNAGHDGLNRAELAAFGIQNLKDENTMYKSLHAQSEQRVKDLSQTNKSLVQEVESLRSKIQQLDAQNAALLLETSEGRAAVERVEEEATQLEKRLKENAQALEDALAESEKSLHLDERVRDLEAQLAALEQSYAQALDELERQKVQTAEAEKIVKEQQERLVLNQKQLRESEGHLAEIEAFKQRTSELLKQLATAEKDSKDRAMGLEQQIEDLRAAKDILTKERDTARKSASHVGEASTMIKDLERRIAAANAQLDKLQTDKTALEASTQKAETEATQARSRFNVLLHESAEKENIWNNVKSMLHAELEQKTRELHHAVEPYIKGFQRIAAEVDEYAPERESDKQLFDKLRLELEEEGIADVDTVASIVVGLRALDEVIDGLDGQQNTLQEKNQRLKAAIRKWGAEHTKEKTKVEGLKKQVNELTLKLKAEKKQSDEKIGQLILALRR